MAKTYIEQLNQAHVFEAPIITRTDPAQGFFPAEVYHQDFLTLNPDYPYIVVNDLPKIAILKRLFPENFRADRFTHRELPGRQIDESRSPQDDMRSWPRSGSSESDCDLDARVSAVNLGIVSVVGTGDASFRSSSRTARGPNQGRLTTVFAAIVFLVASYMLIINQFISISTFTRHIGEMVFDRRNGFWLGYFATVALTSGPCF